MPDESDQLDQGALRGRLESLLGTLRLAAEHNPRLASVIEAFAIGFLGLGLDGIVRFHISRLIVGLSIGIFIAYTWMGREELATLLVKFVAIPLMTFGSFELVIIAYYEMHELEWTPALVEFCIGAISGIYLIPKTFSRHFGLYSCGAFLGPVICYYSIIEWIRPMIVPAISFGGNEGEQGYLIAVLVVGFSLSAIMPLLHFLAWRRRGSSTIDPVLASAKTRAPPILVLFPLTLPVGLIMGFATMLLLLGLRLMLYFGLLGFIGSIVVLALVIYALFVLR